MRAEAAQGNLVGSLTTALEREIGMASDDATEIAGFVAGVFHGGSEVEDGLLSPDLRSIFYTLEGHRLVTFRREERTDDEGQVRRIFFWQLRWENIVASEGRAKPEATGSETVYDRLPVDAWVRAAS